MIWLLGCALSGEPAVAQSAVEISRSAAEAGLRDAARAGDLEVMDGLVVAGVSPDSADEKGYTPLILAAYHGHLSAVELLLTRKADPCRGDARGNTALMGAAFRGHEPIVDRLLRESCPVDQSNLVGQTALMFAAIAGNPAARKLVDAGASRDHRDGMGRTAGDWATTQGAARP